MNTLDKATFSTRLKVLLKEHNKTIYEIAEVCSLNATTISRYKNGLMAPKITTIQVMADYFNVNPAWLMGYCVPRINPCTKQQFPAPASTDEETLKNIISLFNSTSKENKKVIISTLQNLLN